MSATELRVEKLTVPKTSADVARLLQRVLSVRGLVSFSVSKEGVEIRRYRSLHDPPISDESPIEEPSLSVALAMLEDIVELEDSTSIELSILRAAQAISDSGFIPSALVLSSVDDLKLFSGVVPSKSLSAEVDALLLFGYRVAISDLLADGTILLLGSLVASYHFDSVRMAVRIFTKEFSNASNKEETGDNLFGEATTTA